MFSSIFSNNSPVNGNILRREMCVCGTLNGMCSDTFAKGRPASPILSFVVLIILNDE